MSSMRERIRLAVLHDPTTIKDEKAFFKRFGEWPEPYGRRKKNPPIIK
jgi:hypothetical protein